MTSDFKPDLTPAEMLEAGVFGGNYFHDASDADFLDMQPEVIKLAHDNRKPYSKLHNRYEAKAGESYASWMKQGWIFPEDPLGWFHWYCRYANGRRHERDAHQIARHKNYRVRWGKFGRTQLYTRGFASAVVKQGLLQWAIEPIIVLHEG